MPLRRLAWGAAAASGLDAAIHRLAGGSSLTVVGLHRVLPLDDPRRQFALPEFTISDRLFRDFLEWASRHYAFVDVDRVVKAVHHEASLPKHAMLVTFDDGWTDTVDVALPILAEYGIPSLLFVIAGALGAPIGVWQCELHARLWTVGFSHLAVATAWRELVGERSELPADAAQLLNGLMDALEALAPSRRREALLRIGTLPTITAPQMADSAALQSARRRGMAIGAHGFTHERLTGHVDLSLELSGARATLASALQCAPSDLQAMSFPHGRYGPAIVEAARAAGFRLLATSETIRNRAPNHRLPSDLLGRLWVGQGSLADARGRLSRSAASRRFFLASAGTPASLPSPWFRS